jgi:phage repressor protein C with HTH and peptisase S24 domain
MDETSKAVVSIGNDAQERHPQDEQKNIVFVKVIGDMMKPTFKSGDMVLIDLLQKKVIWDGLYAISQGPDIFIRRIQAMGKGMLKIIPDNRIYGPEEAHRDEVTIEGMAIGHITMY